MKKLYVVGLGPGNQDFLTFQARQALLDSKIIAGYKVYISLIRDFFPEAEYFSNGMRGEKERCLYALEKASCGDTVSVVCSGDSAIYGMAGLVFELAGDFPEVEIEVVPGISAALAGSAVLGSPLSSDFAVISLSNLLTPQNLIEKRLRCASCSDFIICLYNPMSHGRPDTLKNACKILLENLPEDRLCAFVRNIGRDEQESRICTLLELKDLQLDMFCTVFIGSSKTNLIQHKNKSYLVSSRGYKIK